MTSEEENQFLQKEIKIRYSDVLNAKVDLSLPESMKFWTKDEPQSKEYCDMMEELSIIARYLAVKITSGPEVKESLSKRCATLSVILSEIVRNTVIDSYHAYGVLSELQNNFYMDISGRIKTLELLKLIQLKTQARIKEKQGLGVV